MRSSKSLFVHCVFFVLLFSASCSHKQQSTPIVIGCASSLQHVMKSLVAQYNDRQNEQFQLRVSSSGKLFAQLKEGSKIDIFIPADSIYAFKAANKFKPELLGFGKLALWTNSSLTFNSLNELALSNIKVLTIPNPKTAPFGRAALQSLERSGNLNTVQDKLVFGQSVADVDNYILLGTTDVALSSLSSKDHITSGLWSKIDTSLYDPIPFYLVQMSDNEPTNKFVEFLKSNEVKLILKENHFNSFMH